MSINGKRDGFSVAYLRAVASVAGLPRGRAAVFADVSDAVAGWRTVAEDAGVEEQMAEQIARPHRLKLAAG